MYYELVSLDTVFFITCLHIIIVLDLEVVYRMLRPHYKRIVGMEHVCWSLFLHFSLQGKCKIMFILYLFFILPSNRIIWHRTCQSQSLFSTYIRHLFVTYVTKINLNLHHSVKHINITYNLKNTHIHVRS
jgi:hypothetical protein